MFEEGLVNVLVALTECLASALEESGQVFEVDDPHVEPREPLFQSFALPLWKDGVSLAQGFERFRGPAFRSEAGGEFFRASSPFLCEGLPKKRVDGGVRTVHESRLQLNDDVNHVVGFRRAFRRQNVGVL